ncbi:MAG: hypothetical protein MUC38_11045 [Cyclobacteriaceae bacterium]|nr:hypothetical protein [Cyclobacteriaceae bacterium]
MKAILLGVLLALQPVAASSAVQEVEIQLESCVAAPVCVRLKATRAHPPLYSGAPSLGFSFLEGTQTLPPAVDEHRLATALFLRHRALLI